jgi:hypothetical protein
MTKKEYADYEASVKAFFEREGIQNLSGGYIHCPECEDEEQELEDGSCPIHGQMQEPWFSWRPCECCGTRLGGNREHATGYNPTTKEIQEYDVCMDCIYYAEYGQLDDQTMLDIEKSEE